MDIWITAGFCDYAKSTIGLCSDIIRKDFIHHYCYIEYLNVDSKYVDINTAGPASIFLGHGIYWFHNPLPDNKSTKYECSQNKYILQLYGKFDPFEFPPSIREDSI